MNYKRIYSQIIKNRLANPLPESEYGQKHHILPKSLYPQYKNTKANIVKLTYREHYICHWLLTKIRPCQEINRAFYMMNLQHNDRYFNSHAFNKMKKQSVVLCATNGFLGKKHTDSAKKKIGDSHRGHKHHLFGKNRSDSIKKQISESLIGGKHFNSIKVLCLETNIIYGSMREAERQTNISHICIGLCCRGKLKKAGGYHWKYLEKQM